MGKVRRVDYYPDEFLSGVDGMSPEQIGVYWLVCTKIYSRGGPIPDNDRENARIFRVDVRTWKRVKAELLAKGKLRAEAGRLTNGRCLTELAKAHKRIIDAHNAGEQGGRPPVTSAEDPAEDSRTVGLTVAEPFANCSANCSATVADKSGHVSSANNDLAKAAGFSGEKLTSNHQPPTTKEEDFPPLDKEGKPYAFHGKIIRLSQHDFTEFQAAYRETIPDLRAQLADDDAYYDRTLTSEDRKKWFHRLKRKLNNLHQRVLRERLPQGNGAALNDSF